MNRLKSLTIQKEKKSIKTSDELLFSKEEQLSFMLDMFENLMHGILILTEEETPIYINGIAYGILERLNGSDPIPKEIHYICQSLVESKKLFPNQKWLMESKVFIDQSTSFNVKARWIQSNTVNNACVLLVMEDQNQLIKDVAISEAEQYGLTPREKEVWLLHRANCTYKEIAAELNITPNTVKKHMKNILTKQQAALKSER